MSATALVQLMSKLEAIMQLSILAPMLVVWLRKRAFPPAIKVLSWYVYLSALCTLSNWLISMSGSDNSLAIISFNIGKIALFGAVYALVMESARMRRLVRGTTLASVVLCVGLALAGLFAHSFDVSVVVSRVVQSAVLAAFALIYLEQTLGRITRTPISHDPIWLLSVGQLLYSAGTVTAFSLDYLSKTLYDQAPKWILIAVIMIIFNGFLTLAFLRAKPAPALAADSDTSPASRFAQA